MPYVIVHSNVNASGVDVDQVLKQVSQAVSKSFGHPEAYVMVQLNLDTPMIFAGTVEV
jgi:phenylpyruvate tautomerase PptA (4-oxalocrotonate tautomerase family)